MCFSNSGSNANMALPVSRPDGAGRALTLASPPDKVAILFCKYPRRSLRIDCAEKTSPTTLCSSLLSAFLRHDPIIADQALLRRTNSATRFLRFRPILGMDAAQIDGRTTVTAEGVRLGLWARHPERPPSFASPSRGDREAIGVMRSATPREVPLQARPRVRPFPAVRRPAPPPPPQQ